MQGQANARQSVKIGITCSSSSSSRRARKPSMRQSSSGGATNNPPLLKMPYKASMGKHVVYTASLLPVRILPQAENTNKNTCVGAWRPYYVCI